MRSTIYRKRRAGRRSARDQPWLLVVVASGAKNCTGYLEKAPVSTCVPGSLSSRVGADCGG
jgi:hypothetical protein